VQADDVLVFLHGQYGAHRIANASETDTPVYLDCDTTAASDTALYLHSNKVGGHPLQPAQCVLSIEG